MIINVQILRIILLIVYFTRMSGEAEYNIAARYRTVRKHLDNLGYKQALSLDALPLIEILLADLIQTTDSLKHFKTIAQENIEACGQLQLKVDPYKCDNARLTRECNQLHSDLIEAKETYQKQIKDFKKQIYKLECECNDLQLASSRNIHKIKELEKESAAKSKKILELQGKCLKPTIVNVGLADKKRPCFPLRRPVLEAEPMPRARSSSSLPKLSNVEPKIIDIVNMADHKMNCLSQEVTKLRGELLLQTDTIETLEKQLATKEKEIIRLRKMLEGGRSYAAVSKDCTCKKASANHDVMENEMRILQQAKLDLEQQLREALNKQHDAMSQAMKLATRNEELEKELRDIDHVALAVEADCNSAVKENNRRVCRLQEKLENVMTQVHVLEHELTVERRGAQELRADLEACRLEKRNIQRTLESTLNEKKQMSDRMNQLTTIEKNLNNEIERLIKENEHQRKDINNFQHINKLLEEQIYMKNIIQINEGDVQTRVKEKGEKNDQNKGMKTLKEKNASKNHENEKYDVDHQAMAKNREVTRDTNNFELQKRIDEADFKIISLQQSIQRLEAERDHYRKEYINCRDEQRKTSDKDNTDLWTRIYELKRDLSDKDQALSKAHQEKENLCHQKEDLEAQLQSYKQRQTCIPCISCSLCKSIGACTCASGAPISFGDINTSKIMLERLERERDTARADVERLIEERDALRERLKMMSEAHTSEQLHLKQSLVEAESRLKHIEKERQDLLVNQGTRRTTINDLEDQLDNVQEELRRTKQELMTQRTQYFQLRTLQDQTDQALSDVQGQLSQAESELNKAVDCNRSMEQHQAQLNDQIKQLKQEINTLRSSMSLLDQEKDRLLMALDEKTEKIASLERELMHKDQQMDGMQQQIRDLQHKNEICVDQSAEQERQLRSLRLEMETIQRQFEAASIDRENAIQENRKLQDDLAAVTCEVRNLNHELETSRAECYDLKKQLQTYVSEVRRAEDLMNRKENERTEMLNHFRSLSMEATVLENNNHSLETEAAEARGALQTAKHQILDLERQLADRDSLVKGYETQISNLTQSVANMESELRQQIEQRHRAEADLMAVRDLCVKLDQQKDALMEQLGDKNNVKAHYEAQLSKLKTEQNIVQDQINRDRVTMERLEALLDQARQESITAQTTCQELQNEISRLKHKVSELQSKLSSESAELRKYQNQAAEYSKQISELRRQVTNERFDRARIEEESRRISEESIFVLRQKPPEDHANLSRPDVRSSLDENATPTSRYLQLEGNKNNDDRPKREAARRTNRFNVSSIGDVTLNITCTFTKNHQIRRDDRVNTKDCHIHYINIILHPEWTGNEVDKSCNQEIKILSSNEKWDQTGNFNITISKTSEYPEYLPSKLIMLQDTDFYKGKNAKTTSTPLQTKNLSKIIRTIRDTHDKSVKIASTSSSNNFEQSNIILKSYFKPLVNLAKDNNNVQFQRYFSFKPRKINITVHLIKKLHVYEKLNDTCVYKKIKRENNIQYYEIDGFNDINKNENIDRLSYIYNNVSDYEMSQTKIRWNDQTVHTVPKNCVKSKLNCYKGSTQNNLSIRDIQKKWTHIECLIGGTLKLLEHILRKMRKHKNRKENIKRERQKDISTQFNQHDFTAVDFTNPEFLQVLIETEINMKNFQQQLTMLNKSFEIIRKYMY